MNTNHKCLKTVLTGLLLVTTVVVAAHAPPPVARSGMTCPAGFHRNGAYCLPTTERARQAIPRTGTVCPAGYARNGAYCLGPK